MRRIRHTNGKSWRHIPSCMSMTQLCPSGERLERFKVTTFCAITLSLSRFFTVSQNSAIEKIHRRRNKTDIWSCSFLFSSDKVLRHIFFIVAVYCKYDWLIDRIGPAIGMKTPVHSYLFTIAIWIEAVTPRAYCSDYCVAFVSELFVCSSILLACVCVCVADSASNAIKSINQHRTLDAQSAGTCANPACLFDTLSLFLLRK